MMMMVIGMITMTPMLVMVMLLACGDYDIGILDKCKMHYHHRNYHHTTTLIKIIIITIIFIIIIVTPIQLFVSSVETRGKSCSMDLPQLSSAHCQWPDAAFCLIVIIIIITITIIIIAVVIIINVHIKLMMVITTNSVSDPCRQPLNSSRHFVNLRGPWD